MIVLGIDPGYQICGYGLIRHDKENSYIHAGYIQLNKFEGNARLKYLQEMLFEIIDRYKPDVAAVEGIFVAKNSLTTIKLAKVLGVVLCALATKNITCYEYSPASVKLSVTGTGKALKNKIRSCVAQAVNMPTLIKQDAYDALSLALCHVKETLAHSSPIEGKILQTPEGLIVFEERYTKFQYDFCMAQKYAHDSTILLWLFKYKSCIYAFHCNKQRKIFEQLIKSNIGPKLSFQISWSYLEAPTRDLSSIKGIGPRTLTKIRHLVN